MRLLLVAQVLARDLTPIEDAALGWAIEAATDATLPLARSIADGTPARRLRSTNTSIRTT